MVFKKNPYFYKGYLSRQKYFLKTVTIWIIQVTNVSFIALEL